MAKARLVTEKVTVVHGVDLTLDATEAGMLLEVLNAHLAGKMLDASQPLGQIRVALQNARVEPVHLINDCDRESERVGYRYHHAVLHRRREVATPDLCGNG